jgi:hypothetical protein
MTASFALTVYPETDGEYCGESCPMMAEEGDDMHGYAMVCVAFDRLDLHHDHGAKGYRYKRLPECVIAESAAAK